MNRPEFNKTFLHPRYWLLWLGLGFLWLLTLLPYRLLMALGRLLGGLLYQVAGSRRRIVQRNLELCFPDLDQAQREAMVKENFASMGMTFFEMTIAWWWPPKRLQRLGSVEGLEHLKQVTAAGEGVILMAFHFTTLEIGGALFSLHHRAWGMYRAHDNPVFDYIQRCGREIRLDGVVEREDVRGMLKVLRAGGTIWYAPDQDYGPKQSIFVPFFGIPAATVTATTKFARLGKAKVIPMTQKRLPGGGYQVTIHPPLADFPSESEEADCLRINQFIETAIRQCPEQYLWAHRRFKTRPEGEAKLYSKKAR